MYLFTLMHEFAAQYATDVTASRFGEKMEDAAQPLRRASRASCAPPRRSCVCACAAAAFRNVSDLSGENGRDAAHAQTQLRRGGAQLQRDAHRNGCAASTIFSTSPTQ